jgi:putative transposase
MSYSLYTWIRDSAYRRCDPHPDQLWMQPNLNARAERWIRAVKEEALSKMILFGERSLWHVLNEYMAHYHTERPSQGKGNVILFPTDRAKQTSDRRISCRERLGGLLKYYDREAA